MGFIIVLVAIRRLRRNHSSSPLDVVYIPGKNWDDEILEDQSSPHMDSVVRIAGRADDDDKDEIQLNEIFPSPPKFEHPTTTTAMPSSRNLNAIPIDADALWGPIDGDSSNDQDSGPRNDADYFQT